MLVKLRGVFFNFNRRVIMDKAVKSEIIKKHGRTPSDTGSTEVQIALLSKRISELTEHMKVHKKDVHSRRGLMTLVSQRRKLLKYLERENHELYVSLTGELELRK